MTKIEAIIRPAKLEELRDDLSRWVTGMTVTEVRGHGRRKGGSRLYRGAEHPGELVPEIKVEVIVPTPLVPRVLDVIERAVRTRKRGDGKIFVAPVEQAVRIRTGDRGEGALG